MGCGVLHVEHRTAAARDRAEPTWWACEAQPRPGDFVVRETRGLRREGAYTNPVAIDTTYIAP